MSNIFSKLLCKFYGHKERRLSLKEKDALHKLAGATSGHHGMDMALAKRQRICRRCGHGRVVRERKARKPKVTT